MKHICLISIFSFACKNQIMKWCQSLEKQNIFFVCPSGREDGQRQLENGLPGRVRRRRTQRVGRSLPPAGPRGVGAMTYSQDVLSNQIF